VRPFHLGRAVPVLRPFCRHLAASCGSMERVFRRSYCRLECGVKLVDCSRTWRLLVGRLIGMAVQFSCCNGNVHQSKWNRVVRSRSWLFAIPAIHCHLHSSTDCWRGSCCLPMVCVACSRPRIRSPELPHYRVLVSVTCQNLNRCNCVVCGCNVFSYPYHLIHGFYMGQVTLKVV